MSVESESEAAWKGFVVAVICGGVGTVIGMIAGFVVGSLADTLVFATTGNDSFLYGYVLAEAGTYVGIAVGMMAGIEAGISTATGAIRKLREQSAYYSV